MSEAQPAAGSQCLGQDDPNTFHKRWKDDMPTSIKQDALLKPEELQEEQLTSPELLASAARLEHKKEHDALGRQRQKQAAKRK